ncbi:MAG TPA: hypothetical protein PLZ55_07775 [bacterium]|nr:hypothetical protein [bacterium]
MQALTVVCFRQVLRKTAHPVHPLFVAVIGFPNILSNRACLGVGELRIGDNTYGQGNSPS